MFIAQTTLRKSLTKLINFNFASQAIIIPQLQSANLQSLQGKYSLASTNYLRAIQIMDAAKLDQSQDQGSRLIYLEAVTKYSACEFLCKKYINADKVLEKFYSKYSHDKKISQSSHKYLCFIKSANGAYLPENDNIKDIENQTFSTQIKSLVKFILGKNKQAEVLHKPSLLPNLGYIAEVLNNRADYKKLLVSLVERSPKSQKSQSPKQNFVKLVQTEPHPELQLLYHLSSTLNLNQLTTADKQLINNRVNGILKLYQQQRQKQVYKPLLNIAMSLIGEKHYMSAQGMIGFIRNQELELIKGYQSFDKILINNLYRMLVTRANNQSYESGWAKQKQLGFGDLVVQRIIKAPLLGHTVEKLIC